MTKLEITPVEKKVFGAVFTNVKIPMLSKEEFAEVHAAFLKYGFLVFPNQHLTEEENVAFGERFGELEFGALPIANQKKRDDGSYREIVDLQTQRMRTNVGNEAWHTDSTYWPVSSK